MQLTDKQLLGDISKQNKAAFDLFYLRYRRLFYGLALSRTNDQGMTNDIMQNFWMIIWQKPETIKTDADGSAKKYLYIYFTSRMSDYMYAANTRLLSNEEANALEEATKELPYTHVIEELATKDILILIEKTLEKMPELTRQIFLKRWKEGYSNKEIAQQFNISESSVNERYKSGLLRVRHQVIKMYSSNSYMMLLSLYWLSR